MRIQQCETVSVNPYKVYVPVEVTFDAEGRMRPTKLRWEDGRVYVIDRVYSVTRSAALKAGGQGDRYEVSVEGHISHLFYEHNPDADSTQPGKWFAQRRIPSGP